MSPTYRFYVLAFVSCLFFIVILHYVMRRRAHGPQLGKLVAVASVVVLGGMFFARLGAQSGLPWWIYYTVPMLLTVSLPPIVFSMTTRETLLYIVLAFLSAPAIHALFSLLFGWKEDMPFLPIPSLHELLGAGQRTSALSVDQTGSCIRFWSN